MRRGDGDDDDDDTQTMNSAPGKAGPSQSVRMPSVSGAFHSSRELVCNAMLIALIAFQSHADWGDV